MKRIVAAIDHSDSSGRAGELAAELAEKYDADLILLSVVRDLGARDPGLNEYAHMEGLRDPVPSFTIDAANERLTPTRDKAMAKGVRRVSTDVRIGEAADGILACLKDTEADLVVIGSRGHGRLTGLLFGSVAHKIAGVAPCPVLIVH